MLAYQTNKAKDKRHFCLRCLNDFPSKESLDKHIDYCNDHEAVKRQFPGAGSKLSYKNYYKSMRVPIVVSADFECFTKPIDTCQPNPKLRSGFSTANQINFDLQLSDLQSFS